MYFVLCLLSVLVRAVGGFQYLAHWVLLGECGVLDVWNWFLLVLVSSSSHHTRDSILEEVVSLSLAFLYLGLYPALNMPLVSASV